MEQGCSYLEAAVGQLLVCPELSKKLACLELVVELSMEN